MRKITIQVIVFVSIYAGFAGTIVQNSKAGISFYLPDAWVYNQSNDSTLVLSDTSFTCRSEIYIKKHTVNKNDYLTDNSWTRAHFIAYLLWAQYSFDPFGAILYFDSTSGCKLDSLWAPEAFSEFYTIDTSLGSWDEYVKYTQTRDFGYEIYALGDTTDMKANLGTYMAIISSIMFNEEKYPTKVDPVRQRVATNKTLLSVQYKYSLLGRQVRSDRITNGIYFNSSLRMLQLKTH